MCDSEQSEFSCAESDVEALMHLIESSDGWEEDWEDYCTVPKGYKLMDNVPSDPEAYLRNHFSAKYDSGAPMFKFEFVKIWHVYKICPCGFRNCAEHVIPSEAEFVGNMQHEGVNLSRRFSRIMPVCTKKQAMTFWSKYPGKVEIYGNKITRRVPWAWSKICKFPKGHELTGCVFEGEERAILDARYGATFPNGKKKYKIIEDGDIYEVKQQCPCGHPCAIHILPSEVTLQSSFSLVMYRRKTKTTPKSVTPIDEEFRKQDAMTLEQAQEYFEQFPLNWKVEVISDVIKFKMICKCKQALDVTPCPSCTERAKKACHLCGKKQRRRSMKKCKSCKKCSGICGDCKRVEISFCPHCKKDVRLDHECVPLFNQHFSFKRNEIYPALLRSKDADFGICPDCKKPSSYKGYHRHQYRLHSDLSGDDLYSRDYEKHECPYCGYFSCDITNVHEHMKFHFTECQHVCRHNCGMKFARPSAEILHCRTVHNDYSGVSSHRVRRVGRQVVRIAKRQKINYVA